MIYLGFCDQLTNSKSEIVYKPLPEYDPKRRKPNIELAKSKLNWEPEVKLKDGLRKTINYFKELFKQ